MDWLKSIGGQLQGWPLLFLHQKRIDKALYNAIICLAKRNKQMLITNKSFSWRAIGLFDN